MRLGTTLAYDKFDFDFYNEVTFVNTPKDLDDIDCLVLWGGADIATEIYNETPNKFVLAKTKSPRDVHELGMIQAALKRNIPLLGICRGAQLLCCVAGGKLLQHIENHGTPHKLKLLDEGEAYIDCNSSHHQMMYPYNLDKDEYTLLAWTDKRSNTYLPGGKVYTGNMDKRVYKEPEVVYFNKLNAMAIQCHPEWHSMTAYNFNAWLLNNIQHFMLK